MTCTSKAPPHLALDRTMRLMRDHLVAEPSDEVLLDALTSRRVTVAADEANLRSPAGQTAFVTTVLLLLRSGTSVTLRAPDVEMLGRQPPLVGTRIVSALTDIGCDLIEGISCLCDEAALTASGATVLIGDTALAPSGGMVVRVCGDALTARVRTSAADLARQPLGSVWPAELHIPFGALAAAGLAAGEIYKIAMRRLLRWAADREIFESLLGSSGVACLAGPRSRDLPRRASSTQGSRRL